MKKVKSQINAFLGKETNFEGKLNFAGTVRIDGKFKGEITTDGTLIVGKTAFIESFIHAASMIVSGEVHGDLVAENRIEIYAPARVIGNIQAPTVTLDEGVVFEGHCQMEKKREEEDHKIALFPKG